MQAKTGQPITKYILEKSNNLKSTSRHSRYLSHHARRVKQGSKTKPATTHSSPPVVPRYFHSHATPDNRQNRDNRQNCTSKTTKKKLRMNRTAARSSWTVTVSRTPEGGPSPIFMELHHRRVRGGGGGYSLHASP